MWLKRRIFVCDFQLLKIVFYLKILVKFNFFRAQVEKSYLCVLSLQLMEVLFLSLQELGGQV
jgi:hypothetical protein